MLHGPLGMKILLFALPLAATGILQQLFNAADVAVVGRFVGNNAMAAVGSNSSIIGIILNLFTGISLGANVVISVSIGAGDMKTTHKAVHTSVLFGFVSGIIFGLLGQLVVAPLLHIMNMPAEVFAMASAYLRIYLLGLPVILLYNFEAAILRSWGDTRTPLIVLTASGIINVILNLFFVCIVGMDASGVALATVISNAVSAFSLFFFLLRHDGPIHLSLRELKIDFKILGRILRIGVPAGVQGMAFSLSNICIQSAINSLGADIMAASSAAFNVEILVYYLVSALGQTCTTFVGQNRGAGQYDRCKKTLRLCLLQDIIGTILIGILILVTGRFSLRIFTKDPVVISYGLIRLRWIVSFEAINAASEVFSDFMRAYGYSFVPAMISLFGICGTRILWVYTVFPKTPTYETLMIVYPISWVVTTVIILFVYFLKKNMFLPVKKEA